MGRGTGAALALALGAAGLSCSRSASHAAPDAGSAAGSALAPALSVRQMPAVVPVRRPDGRPFGNAKERMGHDTMELECDGGARSVTCDDFLGGVDKSCPPRTTLAAVPWTSANLDCHALDLVVHGVPSTMSFLRTFSMRVDRADELPAALWQGPSQEANAALEKASASGKSLRDMVPDIRMVIGTPERAKYESKDDWLEVITFALGDFGSPGGGPPDGVEDVIIQAHSGPKAGSAFYAVLWVLTRKSAGGKLEIVRRI